MNPTIRQFYNKVPAVAGLAVVGLFVAICGLIGMFAPQQKEPTSMTLGQLRGMAAAGQLAPNDPVWKPGMANWVPASSVPGIFG